MTSVEVQTLLKVGDYGLLNFKKTSLRKQLHGKIKYIDTNGTIVFKDNDSYLFLIAPKSIISFKAKEMLPKPTEFKGEPIHWKGGRYYFTATNKECDLTR